MAIHNFKVEIGDQVYVGDAIEEVGAVRAIAPDHVMIYVENAGDFRIEGPAVLRANYGKLILDPAKLDPDLKAAIDHAHEHETD